jgi:phytoene synthase
LPVFGRPDARAFAHALGVALQRTNILRDVAEDARAGRVYLPTEDLARAGLTAKDLTGEFAPPGYRRAAEPLVARARAAFDRARAAVPAGASRALAPALAMGRVYEGVLARIALDPTRVWRERVRPGALERAWRVAIAPWPPPGRARPRRAGA